MTPHFRRLAHWTHQGRDYPRNGQLRTAAGGARETTCLRYCEGKAPGVTLIRSPLFVGGVFVPDPDVPPLFNIDGIWTGEQNDVEVFVQWQFIDTTIDIWPLDISSTERIPYDYANELLNLIPFSFTRNGATFTGTLSAVTPPLGGPGQSQGGVILTRTYRSGINSTLHVT